ncbi:MAG: NAD-dependent epimerase/dehydratase family protein [Actinomycetota bacterium]
MSEPDNRPLKVFVAGATGVLGREAVDALTAAGHQVTGVARSGEKADLLRRLGAEPVLVDLFDPAAVTVAVRDHDAVCNLTTSIPRPSRYFRRSPWEMNDRLHRDASRHLVEGALAAGAERYVQHSVAFMYADGGTTWLDEGSPLDPPPHGLAVVEAEEQTHRFASAGGSAVALRFGLFYGPPAQTARDLLRIARLGFVPLPGPPDAYVSFVHTDDLGPAVAAALRAPSGAYNVVDDDPLTRAELGAVLAAALGRKRLHVAPFVKRMMGKRFAYIARSQRVTNTYFKAATKWTPTIASSRDGWERMVRAVAAERFRSR